MSKFDLFADYEKLEAALGLNLEFLKQQGVYDREILERLKHFDFDKQKKWALNVVSKLDNYLKEIEKNLAYKETLDSKTKKLFTKDELDDPELGGGVSMQEVQEYVNKLESEILAIIDKYNSIQKRLEKAKNFEELKETLDEWGSVRESIPSLEVGDIDQIKDSETELETESDISENFEESENFNQALSS